MYQDINIKNPIFLSSFILIILSLPLIYRKQNYSAKVRILKLHIWHKKVPQSHFFILFSLQIAQKSATMARIQNEFEDIFVSMGYTVYDGPEIESDENCFQKLNIPKGHPARDAQDTFYLNEEYEKYLIRSQTSTAQVRVMSETEDKGPLRIVCPGKVYRRDEDKK